MQPFACTGFAVYGPAPLYGMNFDYPEVHRRLTLTTYGARRVYRFEFGLGSGGYAAVVGMNSDGLFASCQMLFPEGTPRSALQPGEVYVWQAFNDALETCATVQQFLDYLAKQALVPSQTSLHILCADPSGDAVVAEPGEQGNVLTRIEGQFLVMTNFPNGAYQGQSYRDVAGAGADRYRLAYERIRDALATFDQEQALDVLGATAQGGQYATRASHLFDPTSGAVYLALDTEFEAIWRVSLADGTVTTYRGPGIGRKLTLGPRGVTDEDLRAMARERQWVGWLAGAGVVAGALAFLRATRRASGRPLRRVS
jgi:hypothetical protein